MLQELLEEKARRVESKEKEKVRIVQLKEEITENNFILQETNTEIQNCEERLARDTEWIRELREELDTLQMVVNEDIRAHMANLETEIAQTEHEIKSTQEPLRSAH